MNSQVKFYFTNIVQVFLLYIVSLVCAGLSSPYTLLCLQVMAVFMLVIVVLHAALATGFVVS